MLKRATCLIGIVIVTAIMAGCGSRDGGDSTDPTLELSVWTVTGTERILRSASPGTSLSVELYAAVNEYESFQIAVRSPDFVEGIAVQAGDLVGASGSIPASTARLYREHQFYIESPSWGVQDFSPDWYPDALIPFTNPVTGEPLADPEKLRAVPFDLSVEETHVFLVDLYVPSGTEAGVYRGVYRLEISSGLVIEIPVNLTVWDFSLSARTAMDTDFGSPERQMRHLAWLEGKQYSESYWTAVSRQCNELLNQHGITPVIKSYAVSFDTGSLTADGSFTLSQQQINVMQNFATEFHPGSIRFPLTGTPTIMEVVFGSASYDENTFTEDQFTDERRNRLLQYVRSWEQVITELHEVEETLFYIYLCDEPNSSQAYAFVRLLGQALRQADLPRIKVLVVEQPQPDSPSWGDLFGAVDIWVPHFVSYDESSARERQAAGDSIWTYTALTQWGGGLSWQTDLPLLNYRIPTWIAWQYDITGLLYWSMAYWWGPAYPDIWNQSQTYENVWQGQSFYYNGDGVLVYPAETVGYDGIVPSLRLTAIRDGLEDYQFLMLLTELGLKQEALSIVNDLVQSFQQYDTDPDRYARARITLGELISQANGSGIRTSSFRFTPVEFFHVSEEGFKRSRELFNHYL